MNRFFSLFTYKDATFFFLKVSFLKSITETHKRLLPNFSSNYYFLTVINYAHSIILKISEVNPLLVYLKMWGYELQLLYCWDSTSAFQVGKNDFNDTGITQTDCCVSVIFDEHHQGLNDTWEHWTSKSISETLFPFKLNKLTIPISQALSIFTTLKKWSLAI